MVYFKVFVVELFCFFHTKIRKKVINSITLVYYTNKKKENKSALFYRLKLV